MSLSKPKISLNRILIYTVLMLILALTMSTIFNRSADIYNSNNTNSKKPAFYTQTTLTGILRVSTCGGAQSNYSEPPACVTSLARHTAIHLKSGSNVVSQATTSDNGRYTFTTQPGDYTLKVRGEADSDGRKIQVNPGKNEFNFTAILHAP